MFATYRIDLIIFNRYDPYRIIFPQFALFVMALLLLKGLYCLWKGFRTFVWPLLCFRDFPREYGQWAVITGCTQGVGLCYAQELAKRRMNLVLVGRNLAKLEVTARDLGCKYGIQIENIVADFAQGQHIFKIIKEGLDGKDIGILVNNVGVSYSFPMFFNEVSADELQNMININVTAATMMTQIILPKLEAKKKGAIVNLSSMTSLTPVPLLTAYSATKVFLNYFSRGLQYECSEKGITIQTLCPAGIYTAMTAQYSKDVRPSLFMPTPDTFAAHAIRTLGFSTYTTGYWPHSIQAIFLVLISRFPSKVLLCLMKNLRNKAMKTS